MMARRLDRCKGKGNRWGCQIPSQARRWHNGSEARRTPRREHRDTINGLTA